MRCDLCTNRRVDGILCGYHAREANIWFDALGLEDGGIVDAEAVKVACRKHGIRPTQGAKFILTYMAALEIL